ncbi:hypothetical protein P7K49_038163, partial [Saguinus oedipus]
WRLRAPPVPAAGLCAVRGWGRPAYGGSRGTGTSHRTAGRVLLAYNGIPQGSG